MHISITMNYMKQFQAPILVLALFLCFNAQIKAATTDSEGMPVIYLRGEFGHENWMPDNAYKFTRSGNTYTLTINSDNPVPEGKFKIGDDNWEFDFGGAHENIFIDSNSTVTLAHRGANLLTHGIYRGVISFTYTTGKELNVDFNIEESQPSPSDLVSGTLPVMYINVYTDETMQYPDNEVIDYYLDHKDYFSYANYWIDINGCKWMEEEGAKSIGSEEEPLPLQIKARGNWTRIGFSKKPFKLKLDKKQDLLGLTPEKSKHYALLAHADDTDGFLRNFTAFNLGERIGLPWTPDMKPVELVINGDYRGLYFLTESIRVGDGRIGIAELDDLASDPELISGGYVVELDNYDEENQIRLDEKACVNWHNLDRLRVTWDTPEEYSEIQKRFITDQFSAINNAVGTNSNTTWSYLDLDDAARYYLVWEIMGHTEAFHGSTYLFRDRGENQKWHFSPLWDAGNAFRSNPQDFFYNCDPFGNTWIPSLRENSMFNKKVHETWRWFMQNCYSGVEQDMKTYVSHIKEAAKADRRRWKGEPHPDGGQGVADNSDIESRLNNVLGFLSTRVEWLKGKFGDFNNGTYKEPDRDDTPAALLPDYIMAGINDIYEDSSLSLVEYYTLQGLKVNNPKSGEIYIMRKNGESRKVVYP